MTNGEREEILHNIAEDVVRVKKLLTENEKQIKELERQKEDLRRDALLSEEEHEKAFAELEEKIKELQKEIEALCGTAPIHVGTLVCQTKDGWVLILDNHKALYEVPISSDIEPEDLEEGSEVKYTVDAMSGKPLGVFEVRKTRRSEEIALVEALVDENTVQVVLTGDTHKLAGIAKKIRKTTLEKGDQVYYDPVVNYITGKIPRTEKIDLQLVQKKTWEDVGGLKKQIRQVREIVELHFRYPELFKVKGILLKGPPGTGKTLISKVLANEMGVPIYHIAGPEIVSSYVGDSEANLRRIFEQARFAAKANGHGAIIFIDEIEAITEKRDEAEHSHDRRLVAQLLALMDGLTSMEKVIVIAATNRPNLLDPALRRPGRFTEEIEIPVPDRDGRLEILRIHMKDMPLAPDVSPEALADVTHGFTGADLEGLCQKSVYLAFRAIDLDKIDSKSVQKTKVTKEHFDLIFKEMKPSIMREVVFQKPTETWADVGGLEDIKQKLEEAIKWKLKYPELVKKAGYTPPRGILLYGPSGTGKTLLAKALCNECGVNFIPIKGPALINKYVGESEKNVRDVFQRARESAPCVIFFDEIDALVSMRGMHSGDAGVSDKVTAQLLTELDGIEGMTGVFVLAATNRLDLVDPALLRAGRFDEKIYLPPPGKEARLKIFKIHTRGKSLADDVDFGKLVKRTEPVLLAKQRLSSDKNLELRAYLAYTGADIANICQRASQIAIREFVATRDPQKDYDDFKVFMRHFEEILKEVAPSAEDISREDTDQLNGEKTPPSEEGRKLKPLTDKDLEESA